VDLVLVVFSVSHAPSLDKKLSAMVSLNVSGVHMCGRVQQVVGGATEEASHTVASLAASAREKKKRQWKSMDI